MELSLCMIVKDEEAHLGACLESIWDAVDEIIVVDTGSNDRTKEIAGRYTPHVYDYVWKDDFADARNASFSYATKPFVLWLDADDVLDEAEREKLIALKERLNQNVDAVMMPYHYAFAQDGTPSLVFERERIVRRDAGFRFSGAVHEAMAVSGHVIHEDIVIRHTGQHGEESNRRNLAIYEKLLAEGRILSARDWYYYARELRNAGETKRAIGAFDTFLKMDGWIENRIDACIQRGECLCAIGERRQAKESFMKAMLEGSPRAEALCALGACFMEEGELETAEFWYRAALLCRQKKNAGAFTFPEMYGYVPLMQLCVIYSKMGDDLRASQMNEQALLLRPDDPAALFNRNYFANRLGRQEIHG